MIVTPLAQALNLPRTRLFRALGVVTALLALTVALLAGGALLLQQLYSGWQLQRHNSVLLYLPPETTAAALTPLTTTLPTLAGVAGTRAIPAAELYAALEPMLPAQINPSTLPLPVVIEVTLSPLADRPKVLAALAQTFPLAELDDQQTMLGRVAESVRLLQAVALGLALLLGAILATFMVLVIRAGLLAQEGVVRLLLQLGATDKALALTITQQTLQPVALGTAVGTVAAMAVMLTASLWPGSPLSPNLASWLGLVLMPLVLPCVAAGTGWVTSLRLLHHHDGDG